MTAASTGSMAPVDLLVMDLGGVVCQWVPDRRLHALTQLSGLPGATIDAQVFESGFDDAAERGQFTLDEFTGDLEALLGIGEDPASTERLRAAWALAFEPDARVLELVGRVSAPTALFTNNGPLLEDALHHELGAVGAAFDRVLCSWHLGATKPDPEAFSRASAALDVDPGAIFFVDDRAANVDAAHHAGWQAHHFRDVLNLTAALADAGVLER